MFDDRVVGIVSGKWWKMPMGLLTWAVLGLSTGCLPVVQRPGIEPGFHLDGGVSYLADQPRDGRGRGNDYMVYLAPAWGINEQVEVGLPLGLYLEEGWGSLGSNPIQGDYEPVIAPYLKFGLLEPGGSDRLAVSLQFAAFLPAILGVQYGRDLGDWRPWVSLSAVGHLGPAGDSPFVTRFQQKDQSVWLLAGGLSRRSPHAPSLEIGVMRNAFEEGAVFGDFGQETVPRTLYDLYVGLRFRFGFHGSDPQPPSRITTPTRSR